MLYIRGHKIIKGYIGNTPVSHVGFGKSGLIKIKSESGIKIAEYKFSNSYDLVPVFNEGFVYNYEDVIDGKTTIRTIYSTELPTKIRFSTGTPESTGFDGREKALLEVLCLDNRNLKTEEQMFQMCTNLTKVDGFVSNIMHKTNHMFSSCYNLRTVNASNWDTSNVRYMQYMFYDCTSLTSLDLSNFNTSNVYNMNSMFRNCQSLTSLDVSNFNTSKVTNMGSFIVNASALKSFISCAIPVSFGASGTSLTHDSLMSIINNLATVTTTQTLTLGSTNLAKLSSEEKAIAINKGWKLA